MLFFFNSYLWLKHVKFFQKNSVAQKAIAMQIAREQSFVKPWTPPPVERPSVSRHWNSKPPDSTPPFTTPPRSKPKQSKPYTLLTVMPSGQYRGKTFEEIFATDQNFFVWVLQAHPMSKIIKASVLAFLKTKFASR